MDFKTCIFLFALLGGALSVSITPMKSKKLSLRGVVQNPAICEDGPPDQVQQVRITGCTLQPCSFRPGLNYFAEIDFIASRNCEDLHLEVDAIMEGHGINIIDQMMGVQTAQGSGYTLSLEVTPSEELLGSTFGVQMQVSCKQGGAMIVEFCRVVTARVENPTK